MRKIALVKRQRGLKAKVNSVIREMAKARGKKTLARFGVKQPSLMSKGNEEIQNGVHHQLPARANQGSQENREIAEDGDAFLDTIGNDCIHPISGERIATQKLVESVIRVSDARQKQEKVIRSLTREITQQRADFEALNKRVVDDKKELYRMLEDLMRENEMLKKTLVEQTTRSKFGKTSLHADGK